MQQRQSICHEEMCSVKQTKTKTTATATAAATAAATKKYAYIVHGCYNIYARDTYNIHIHSSERHARINTHTRSLTYRTYSNVAHSRFHQIQFIQWTHTRRRARELYTLMYTLYILDI